MRFSLDPDRVDALQGTLASYLGHLRWASTRRLTAALAGRHPCTRQHFAIDAAARRLARRYDPVPSAGPVRVQYARWRRRFPGDALFFQLGRFCELYQARDAPLARTLGLRRITPNRRGARWGFPVKGLGRYLAAALAAGWPVTLVLQGESPAGTGVARGPVARYVPVGGAPLSQIPSRRR
jgi:hypothetical protein